MNGLDPDGILWIRNLMKAFAAEGRTVFVSSPLTSEMAVTADHLIVIGRGKLLADMSTADFIKHSSQNFVRVRSPQATGVQRAVIGTGLYLGVVGLFALGIGGILRHTAGAVTTVLGFMLLPTMLGALLPQWWQDNVVRYLPFNAGGQIMSVTVPPGTLARWTGFAILCAWAAAALILAIVLLEKRDA